MTDRSDPAEGRAGPGPAPAPPIAGYADVALPVPLPEPLVYGVPLGCDAIAQPGVRVRVRIGRRPLTGVIVGRRSAPPEGVTEVKPLEAILDRAPVVVPDLLELARFTAAYYLAPLGEVLRSMLPAAIEPWGDRRVWLTDGGALAPERVGPAAAGRRALLDALRGGGRFTLSQLQASLGLEDLDDLLASLEADGLVASEDSRSRTARYVTAFELAPALAGSSDEAAAARAAAVGRSAPGRAAADYLAAAGRPATAAEVIDATGASAAVLRRLVAKGVLRNFTQLERLSLDRHRMASMAPRSPMPTISGPARLPAAIDLDPTGHSGGGGEPAARAGGAIVLRPDQQTAADALIAALRERRFAPFLLQGMTGSGKTEVYLRAAAAAADLGRASILLVPEIALVPALARELLVRFGNRLAILHSGLGSGERNQEWERVRDGEATVVLGPRSALFAPVRDLGLIVVDEEQDPAYKQESDPRYQARDLALVRARTAGAAALLVSATPSLESRHNVALGKLGLLRLERRVGQGSLPEGVLVDLRQEEDLRRRPGDAPFSARLKQEITATLEGGLGGEAGDQVILLRNRRGYSPMLLCRACGEAMRCPDCGLPRTYHRGQRRLLCHYCGAGVNAPDLCPICHEPALEPIGAGTERVEEDFRALFPGVAVDVLDRDTARRPGGLAAVLERFERGDTRVLIGTQMVSKGHHFPRVALVAVLTADSYLSFPDFRAVERTYNLLTQVAGRAGRGDRPGKVVIQTYHPDHYAIQAALTGNDAAFLDEELRFRRAFHYPPYTRLVQLLVTDRKRERAQAFIQDLATKLARHPLGRRVRLSGPAPAPLERLRGDWRFQLLARAAAMRDLHQLLAAVLPRNPGIDLVVDVDPQQLM